MRIIQSFLHYWVFLFEGFQSYLLAFAAALERPLFEKLHAHGDLAGQMTGNRNEAENHLLDSKFNVKQKSFLSRILLFSEFSVWCSWDLRRSDHSCCFAVLSWIYQQLCAKSETSQRIHYIPKLLIFLSPLGLQKQARFAYTLVQDGVLPQTAGTLATNIGREVAHFAASNQANLSHLQRVQTPSQRMFQRKSRKRTLMLDKHANFYVL